MKQILFLLFLLLGFAQNTTLFAQCNPSAHETPLNGTDEDCDGLDDLFLAMPPKIYALEGQDMEIYFHNLILSKHPQDYEFAVNTPLNGTIQGKKWAFTPAQNSAGSYPLTIQVKVPGGQVLQTGSTTIVVSADEAPSDMSAKKILLFGHSFFDQGYLPKYLYDKTHTAANPPITFHGKKESWANSNARHEGYGGMMARWFFRDPASPIRYGNQVNIRQYFNDVLCSGCNPDWLVFHLDINDFCGYTALAGNTLQEIDDSITNDWNAHAARLIDLVRATSPNTKIAICISPPPNARESAFAQTYGGNPTLNNRWRWQKIINRIMHKNIERYGNRESENIYLIPEYTDLDDMAEYNPPDARHPDPPDNNINTHCGYNEIAKSVFAWIKWAQHNPNGSTPVLNTYYQDLDGDNFGNYAQSQTAANQPAGFVLMGGDCNDNNANVHPSVIENCMNDLDDNCNGQTDEDFIAPQALCKSQVYLNLNDDGAAFLSINRVNDGSFDACGAVTLALNQNQFSCADVGQPLQISLTVWDESNNSATCQTTLNVRDIDAPIAICTQDLQLNLAQNGNLTIMPDLIGGGSYDVCDNTLDLVLSQANFNCQSVGNQVLTLTATDASGNSATCAATVFIKDNSAPEMEVLGGVQNIPLASNGTAFIYLNDLVQASDVCSGVESLFYSFDNQVFTQGAVILATCALLQQDMPLPLYTRASDVSGNFSSTVTAYVHIKDLTPPRLQCIDLTVSAEATGAVMILESDLQGNATDACSNVEWIAGDNLFIDCSQVGSIIQKMLTAKDEFGNVATCNAMISVLDELDTDLDGATDCQDECPFDVNLVLAPTWYIDSDMDGFGQNNGVISCLVPPGSSSNNLDCDDSNTNIFPGSLEIINDADDDCDGEIDEGLIATYDLAAKSVSIFPNPVSNLLNIDLRLTQSKLVKIIEILSPNGASIMEISNPVLSSGKAQIATNNLPQGVYFLRIKFQNGDTLIGRFLKIGD